MRKGSNVSTDLSVQDKVISLFQYIGELNKLKTKTITNIDDYSNNANDLTYKKSLSDIPTDKENIVFPYEVGGGKL